MNHDDVTVSISADDWIKLSVDTIKAIETYGFNHRWDYNFNKITFEIAPYRLKEIGLKEGAK